ncbi:lytic transglycosylase domain-containing protein [Cognatishimia sp. F0-27]|uniref:lytic transglycosylase domain-containing protein n=1 Tax=Cognatishimia sp. F0-27 TaxID=2816855 RepID=UPI001D0C0CC6|nr:lytic transglycosylase domain-containing protein [Cognatishimia sp. F0-27]MCC1492498.1 lytic transglycosylase domain-containing protein [Cognatishimia sp. F0-27]
MRPLLALVLAAVVLAALVLSSGELRAHASRDPATQCSPGAFGPVQCIRPAHRVYDLCQAIETLAHHHGLDPGFFARLLWQESRFDPHARSPANAQGIAQFIPATAARRGLRDPYNPAEALEYSAEYLGDLTRRYGSFGMAAIAYNGGEGRANGLVAGSGWLAQETVDYVQIITGLPAQIWRDAPPQDHDYRLQKDIGFQPACYALARQRVLTPYPEPKEQFSRWGVQVAFGTTRDRARRQFSERMRACTAVIDDEEPELIWQRSRASPRGGYFMARLGRDTQDTAWRLCRDLKAKGCLCAVYRNAP